MIINYKGTIIEISPEEYRYVTQVDLKPCSTIAGDHDAHCITCFEAVSPSGPVTPHRHPAATSAIPARKIVSNGRYPPRSNAPR